MDHLYQLASDITVGTNTEQIALQNITPYIQQLQAMYYRQKVPKLMVSFLIAGSQLFNNNEILKLKAISIQSHIIDVGVFLS
jgi:hypothetical protein